MVLTGRKALELSGCVSAKDDLELGGYSSVMGANGQAQGHALDLPSAYQLLYRFYQIAYCPPHHKRSPRRRCNDPLHRSIGDWPYPQELGHGFTEIKEIFSSKNSDRKRPFSVRPIMQALIDQNTPYLERWQTWQGAETVVAWQSRVYGYACTLIGIENQAVQRLGTIEEGPTQWQGGTLYPQASRKLARAIRASQSRYPVVILANLSGFDGSPESLRQWQLEYGADIAQAVTGFDGPIYLVVLSRYHGGAYVVFSKSLNPNLEVLALQGSFASVIGGGPAASVIFKKEVRALEKEYGASAEGRNKL
jgi:acetyl-CoA carboxylase carboxyltransferase component